MTVDIGRRLERCAPWGLLALAVALCGKGLFSGGKLVLGSAHDDMALQFLPWCDFGFRELKAGNLAFWNPHIFSGIPFFADFESALLYPPNWLHLVIPLGHAVNILVTLHLFLAGFLTYLWCRRSGQDPLAAGIAGTMYMLGAPYYLGIYGGILPPLWVMTWIPAVFLSLDGWLDERDPAWCLLGMAAVALQALGGYPQLAYYTGLGAGLYLVLRLPGSPAKAVIAAGWLAVYVGGLALTAAQLLPAIGAMGESVRAGGLPLSQAAAFSFPPENLLTSVCPFFFGDMRGFPYFGRCHLFGSSLFIGVSGLVLALCGAAWAKGPGAGGAFHGKDRRRRIAAVMAGATLLLALGTHLKPLYWTLYHLVPGYGAVRGTQKFLVLTSLFLAWLAGAGLQDLLREPGRRTASALATLAAAAAAACAGLWGWASGVHGTAGAAWTRLLRVIEDSGECLLAPLALIRHPVFVEQSLASSSARLTEAAGMLALVAALLWLVRHSRRWAVALGLLAVCELVLFARATTAVMSSRPAYPAEWRNVLERNPGDYRILHAGTGSPNIAMTAGLHDVMGYCPLPLKRYADFLSWTQGLEPGTSFPLPRLRRVDRAFEMLRLRYVFSAGRKPSVQELPSPMPRLNLVHDWKLVHGPAEALKSLGQPGFDPRRTVILESPPDPLPGKAGGAACAEGAGAGGTATILRSSTDDIEIAADLPEPAILLVTDSYSKGWSARPLDPGPKAQGPQASYQVLPADSTLMAVPLAAGRHRFLLEYAPPMFRLGLIISLVSLTVFAAAWAAVLTRRAR
ncbi:MAG: hypothetical protein HY748_03660 [Elusimicrobia bacterium]|nr:hypothetical protein [Elusimicrobiota bacterium]